MFHYVWFKVAGLLQQSSTLEEYNKSDFKAVWIYYLLSFSFLNYDCVRDLHDRKIYRKCVMVMKFCLISFCNVCSK
jgi:hypothetical protein